MQTIRTRIIGTCLASALMIMATGTAEAQEDHQWSLPGCGLARLQPAATGKAKAPVLKATVSASSYQASQPAPVNTQPAIHIRPLIKQQISNVPHAAIAMPHPKPALPQQAQTVPGSAAQIQLVAETLRRYKHTQHNLVFNAAAPNKTAFHWGDKSCSCHQGMVLFQQHKYIEAAAFYKKAGDDLLRTTGGPSTDVANARRGQAVALAAAGKTAEARDLFFQAVELYIKCGHRNPPHELESSVLDLSEIYRRLGKTATANAIKARMVRIAALSRENPALASAEFVRVAAN